MTDKQAAVEMLARLPETASLSQITEEMQVMAAIRQGQADVAAARVRPHAEVVQLFSSWAERWTTSHSSI